MKRVLVLLLMLWIIPSPSLSEAASAGDTAQRDGTFIGFGAGLYELTTSWYWYNWSRFPGRSRLCQLILDLSGPICPGLIGKAVLFDPAVGD